ncbi:MAG: taurine dioxygenase [Gammaproteobacteria bacterium]
MNSVSGRSTTSQFQVERLTGTLGARVVGLDCRAVDDAVWDAVLAVFHTHHLLVFPGQRLTPENHAAFMARFGELDIHPQELSARSTLPLPGHPSIELMANEPGNYGPRASAWHTDVTFRQLPPAVTSLYGVQTPSGCADTVWVNMRGVFESFSPGMKTVLRSLDAVHATAFSRGAARAGSVNYDPTQEADPRKYELQAQYRDPVVHPVVHAHEAGYETLYVNPAFVSGIDGWSDDESESVLACVYQRATEPVHMYRHRWSQNDLVLWDNRCLMHYGVNDYGEDDRRILHRTTGAPFEVHASRPVVN